MENISSVVLAGHTNYMNSVEWSPDGAFLISASDDSTIRLWDVRDLPIVKVIVLTGHTKKVHSLSWNPDSNHFLSGSDDETMRLWDITNFPTITSVIINAHDEAHGSVDDGIRVVTYNTLGTAALTASFAGSIRLWNFTNSNESPAIPVAKLTSWMQGLAWSKDSKLALAFTGNEPGRFTLINLKVTRAFAKEFADSKRYTSSVAWSPCGSLALIGSRDQTTLWDFRDVHNPASLVLESNADSIASIAWRPDGCYALTACLDKTIRLWDFNPCQSLSLSQTVVLLKLIRARKSGEKITMRDDCVASVLRSLPQTIKQKLYQDLGLSDPESDMTTSNDNCLPF